VVKEGDVVTITWVDGLVLQGTFMRKERGYLIVKDSNGKEVPCLPSHLSRIELMNGHIISES
jgi:hypothetical protein